MSSVNVLFCVTVHYIVYFVPVNYSFHTQRPRSDWVHGFIGHLTSSGSARAPCPGMGKSLNRRSSIPVLFPHAFVWCTSPIRRQALCVPTKKSHIVLGIGVSEQCLAALSKCFVALGSIEGVVGSKHHVPLPARGLLVKSIVE